MHDVPIGHCTTVSSIVEILTEGASDHMCGCLSLIACRVPQGSINSLGRCYPNLGIIAPLQVFWFLEAKFRPPSIWKPSGRAFSAHQARSATGCKLWGGAGPPSVRARPRICRIFPPAPTHPQILLPTKIEPNPCRFGRKCNHWSSCCLHI